MSKTLDSNIIKYRTLTLEHEEAALNLQIETSMQECLSIGFGVSDNPEGTDRDGFRKLLRTIIKDGFTIGAFDDQTNELVGVCFNKVHLKSELDTEELETNVFTNMKNPATLDLMRFIFKIESSVDIYDFYGVNCALEIFYIGVDEKYRRYGIGRKLMEKTFEKLEEFTADQDDQPQAVYGVFTSNYSKALAQRFDFEWLNAVRYDEYICWDGKTMAERLGSFHKSAVLGARRL